MKFQYVGDGSIIINGKSPDFINVNNKIIILANSIYYHLTIYKIKDTSQNRKKHERTQAAPFKKAGYRVIIIWDDEFNRWQKDRAFGNKIKFNLKRYLQ
jgi:G:T-mismatch repair DNA endonuclease (very short patch repair protein)